MDKNIIKENNQQTNTKKQLLRLLIALMVVMSIKGVSNIFFDSLEKKMNTYTNKNNTFSISLPGKWSEEDSEIGEQLALSNKSGATFLVIRRVPDISWASNNMDQFIEYYKQIDPFAFVESQSISMKDININVDGMETYLAMEFDTAYQDVDDKIYIILLKTDSAIYDVFVSCVEEAYDIELEQVQEMLSGLTEK